MEKNNRLESEHNFQNLLNHEINDTNKNKNELIHNTKELINSTLNLNNIIRIIIAELISNQKIDLINLSNKEIIQNLDTIFLKHKYPTLSLIIKKKINTFISYKSNNWVDLHSYLTFLLSNKPENVLKNLINDLDIDFYNPENMSGVYKNDSWVQDIPIQAKEANDAWVKKEYNGTIWILKDSKSNIVANKRVKEVISNWFLKVKNFNDILNYNPGIGNELFIKAIELLIKREEKLYQWPKIKWVHTPPYFIPWWGWWLTIARDYFLDEWDLVLLPNYRWPNIDWIIINKTKVLPAELDLIKNDWKINYIDLENQLQQAISIWRKKITIYLNFPWNPSWTRLSVNDAEKLNTILKSFEDNIHIQILLDDPYWAFSITNNSKKRINKISTSRLAKILPNINNSPKPILTAPLSYYIDTSNNIDIIELWSHWTKESWVYWLRIWSFRVFTSQKKVEKITKNLNKAFRETFSMSPSIQQNIMSEAILWTTIEEFNKSKQSVNEFYNKWDQKYINSNIDKYIAARTDMLKIIYPKIDILKQEILNNCSDFLIAMENKNDKNESETGWFVINFTLTDKAKKQWLDLEKLRQICLYNWYDDIAFTTFENNINNEKSMRVSLISWKPKVFAKRLKIGIDKLLKK